MRIKTGVTTVELQRGSILVEPGLVSTIAVEVASTNEKKPSIILSPVENVSVTPFLQNEETFLITTSDTSAVTASYVIASTR
jgi:hypothetical protein